MKTIVIINNDVNDLEILEAAIKKTSPGAHCISFVFPDEALLLLDESLNAPDYIFIDMNINRVTAGECLHTLHQNRKFRQTKIVIISNMIPDAVGQSFVKLGAFDYFQKPLLDSMYQNEIAHVFEKTRRSEVAVGH
jgi:DNA-binding NtrC family response regulator